MKRIAVLVLASVALAAAVASGQEDAEDLEVCFVLTLIIDSFSQHMSTGVHEILGSKVLCLICFETSTT